MDESKDDAKGLQRKEFNDTVLPEIDSNERLSQQFADFYLGRSPLTLGARYVARDEIPARHDGARVI